MNNNPMEKYFTDMENLFNKNLKDLYNDTFFNGNKLARISNNYIATDIINNEKEYVINCNVPGYTKEEISIEIIDNYLVIIAEKKEEKEENKKEGNYIKRERFFSSLKRNLELPEDTNIDEMKAKLENGVLQITIQKIEPTKPEAKKINIE